MKAKTALFFIFITICLAFTTACQAPTNNSEIYRSDNVKVSLIENTNTTHFAEYEWMPIDDEYAYTQNSLIITGTVSNIRQATVSYEFMDTDVIDNITIFDVTILGILSCHSGSYNQGDTITIGVGYNSNMYGEGLPIIENGKSYMMFCNVAADYENDVLELANYVDCWISAPKDLLLEKIGDYYLAMDYFSDIHVSDKLSGCADLTSDKISLLSNISTDNTAEIRSFINNELIISSTPGSIDLENALFVLKQRTMNGSSTLYNLLSRSSLIKCSDLETFVRNAASEYDN